VKARMDSRQTQNIKASLVVYTFVCVCVCVCVFVLFGCVCVVGGWVLVLVDSRGENVIFLHV